MSDNFLVFLDYSHDIEVKFTALEKVSFSTQKVLIYFFFFFTFS